MCSRSKYWYIGIIFLILFQVNIEAKDICNNTNSEQIVTDGENEQYIPPHMCVSVSEESQVVEETKQVSQETEEIIIETKTQEPEIEVQKVDNEPQNTTNSEAEEVEETQAPVEEKSYKEVIIIPIVIIVAYIIIRRYR